MTQEAAADRGPDEASAIESVFDEVIEFGEDCLVLSVQELTPQQALDRFNGWLADWERDPVRIEDVRCGWAVLRAARAEDVRACDDGVEVGEEAWFLGGYAGPQSEAVYYVLLP